MYIIFFKIVIIFNKFLILYNILVYTYGLYIIDMIDRLFLDYRLKITL